MMNHLKATHDYSPLQGSECEKPLEKQSVSKRGCFYCLSISGLAIFSVLVYAIVLRSFHPNTSSLHPAKVEVSACSEPSIRHEWRSLSKNEKLEYIAAVQCLSSLPSKLGLDQSLHQDFPYIHSLMGNSSHGKLAFLPWHRYFLHLYETTLREECGYQGHLTYWDWTLDWENLRAAPVWDSVYGFGGNGNSSAEKSVAYGHCVTDGPFANLELLYWGNPSKVHKHCLSRGFVSVEEARKYVPFISPTHVDKTLALAEYSDFYVKLEFDSHNTLPNFIRGEFYDFTAPNDPVFYLHHVQLDRLWMKWQLLDRQNRVRKLSTTLNSSILERFLDMGALAKGVNIAQVLDTHSDLLCYGY